MTSPARRQLAILGFAVLLCAVPQSSVAHEGASGIVKTRMDAMKVMGGAMKQLADMMKGVMAFDAAVAARAGQTIHEKGKGLLSLFPGGSLHTPSQAKAEVWSRWPDFEAQARALSAASAALAAVDGGAGKGQVLKLFAALGKSCTGCHKDFREPDDK